VARCPEPDHTRNSAVSKLRRWLGAAADGTEHLPDAAAGYRLHPDVRSDWHLWLGLLLDGPAVASTEALAAALELVKGQPFAGVNTRTYVWSERDKQEMISAIGDAAHELARRALLAGDATLARQAAAAGLQADPGAELLWRDALRAEWLAGDLAGLNSTADRLVELTSKLGDDLEPETDSLLEELLSRATAGRHPMSITPDRPPREQLMDPPVPEVPTMGATDSREQQMPSTDSRRARNRAYVAGCLVAAAGAAVGGVVLLTGGNSKPATRPKARRRQSPQAPLRHRRSAPRSSPKTSPSQPPRPSTSSTCGFTTRSPKVATRTSSFTTR